MHIKRRVLLTQWKMCVCRWLPCWNMMIYTWKHLCHLSYDVPGLQHDCIANNHIKKLIFSSSSGCTSSWSPEGSLARRPRPPVGGRPGRWEVQGACAPRGPPRCGEPPAALSPHSPAPLRGKASSLWPGFAPKPASASSPPRRPLPCSLSSCSWVKSSSSDGIVSKCALPETPWGQHGVRRS